MQPKKRPPKKTAMLEVRVSPEDKADFLSACLESGQSASAVIRKAMRTHARRIEERPGRVKMTMTMMVMLPILGMIGPAQPVSQTEPVTTEPPVCNGETIRRAPIWPVGAAGGDLELPEDGIEFVLRFDRAADGRATNIRPVAPQGHDAFVTAAVAALREWCFPVGVPLADQEVSFEFSETTTVTE